MGDLGFWALAQEDPDYLALVTPEGDEVKAGVAPGDANQLGARPAGPGFRGGLGGGHAAPQLRRDARGRTWPPSRPAGTSSHQPPPGGARGGVHPQGLGGQAFIAHERFGAVAVAAADEVGLGATGRLACRRRPGVRLLRRGTRRPADDAARGPHRRRRHELHVGDDGNPKGIYRKLIGVTPEQAALGLSGLLFLFGIQPQDDNVHIIGSPLYHTAVLRFGSVSMHLGHTIVLMDKWQPEDMLRLIEERRVTTSHMVPTQFHRLLALPEDVRAKYDVVLPSAT